MTKNRRNGAIRVLSAVFVLLICLFATFSFVGCDEKQSVSAIAYNLYLAGCNYDEDALEVTAYVTVSGNEEQRLDGARAFGSRRFAQDGLFYNKTDIAVNIDCAEVYRAVREKGVMSTGGEDATQYQRLQVVLRYDTIYKSIVTNGERHPAAGGYVDILPLDEEGNREFRISQRSQNSANWYSLLVAAGIALFAALTIAYLAYVNKKEKSEAKSPKEVAYAEEGRRE